VLANTPMIGLSDIKRPGEIVLMGDVLQDPNGLRPVRVAEPGPQCDATMMASIAGLWRDPPLGLPSDHATAQLGPSNFNFMERHNGTGNAGFCDGHVKAMKHRTLYNNGSNTLYFDYSQ